MGAFHQKIERVLLNEPGNDFLSALPLIAAQYGSDALTHALRRLCTNTFRDIEKTLGCEVCVAAFGSLGRAEFVPDYSDLDPLIIVKKCKGKMPSKTDIREAILGPLARHNMWLLLDDDVKIRQGEWKKIENADIKYPVYDEKELQAEDEIASQRRWQLLLESRVLYREADFDDLRERIVPKTVNKRRTGSHQRESIDFEEIAKSIPQFFNGFDNPAFLYKDNFKYWKTRFLRDFYTFANMINIVLGVHLDEDGENLTSEFLSGSIAVKIIRSAKFADEIEKQDIKNSKLRKNHFLKLSQIMKKHGLGDVNLLMYGNGYETKAARTLHGLMAGLLERFSRCWDEIYDKDVRDALKSMKKINFDSKFSPEITDEKMKSKIETWESMRGDYRQFMATIAEVVHQFFIVEQLWTRKYVGAYEKCLPPFFTTKYK